MVDTVRSMAELLSMFADGQPDGAITAQDCRDLIVSTAGQTGWADYQDNTYSDLSRQSLPAGVATKIEINPTAPREQELPFGISSFWDSVNNEIIAPSAGAGIMVSFETTIARVSGSGQWEVKTFIDIGIPGPVELYPRSIVQDNGTNDKKITWTTGAYSLDTWVANGGGIFVEPEVAADCYNSRVIIHQIHRGRGTYPPA